VADEKPADPNSPAPAADDEIQTAKVHHKDKGHVVKTAFGETLSGGIADIADGDDA
jgi:hypothetical protein